MRIAFLGTSGFAVPALRALAEAGHSLGPVISPPARPSGRGRRLVASPVEVEARALGLEVLTPDDPNDPSFVARFAAAQPEVAVLAAYGFILRGPLLRVPGLGFLNIHPSLLPQLRGPAPIQRAIMAGERETGVTVIALSEQVDAGDILKQVAVSIGPDETAGGLEQRLAAVGARLIGETLTRIARGTDARTPQDAKLATRAPRLAKSERRVDWSESACRIHNRIRALSPEPGAVTSSRNGRLILLRSRLPSVPPSLPPATHPGQILLEYPGLFVATGDGVIEITELKPAGRRPMTGQDFRNGLRPVAGDRLAVS